MSKLHVALAFAAFAAPAAAQEFGTSGELGPSYWDGRGYDMELHLVHRSESGALAVLGVFLQRGAAAGAALRGSR